MTIDFKIVISRLLRETLVPFLFVSSRKKLIAPVATRKRERERADFSKRNRNIPYCTEWFNYRDRILLSHPLSSSLFAQVTQIRCPRQIPKFAPIQRNTRLRAPFRNPKPRKRVNALQHCSYSRLFRKWRNCSVGIVRATDSRRKSLAQRYTKSEESLFRTRLLPCPSPIGFVSAKQIHDTFVRGNVKRSCSPARVSLSRRTFQFAADAILERASRFRRDPSQKESRRGGVKVNLAKTGRPSLAAGRLDAAFAFR